METSLPQTIVSCTQCGGELHPDEGQLFLTCPYCNSAVYLDKSKVVFHWYLAPTLDEGKARGALARWMAGNQTVKDLDKKAQIVGSTFEYFPVWYFKRRDPDGREQVLLEPAAATAISEIRHIQLPAGDLRKYEGGLDAQAHTPTRTTGRRPGVAGGAAGLPRRDRRAIPGAYPALYFQIRLQKSTLHGGRGGRHRARIRQYLPGQGRSALPAGRRSDCAGLSVPGALPGLRRYGRGGEGAGIGLALCVGLGLVAAPLLLALAAWVAAKI